MLRTRDLDRYGYGGGYLDRGWPPPTLREVRARWLAWLWRLALAVGFVWLVAAVVGHDDPRPGLSDRSWLTLGLAVALVGLLLAHQRAGVVPLLRALAEYSIVAVLVVLLATGPGALAPVTKHPAHPPGRAGAHATTARASERAANAGKKAVHGCPPFRQVLAWVGCLWRQAQQAHQPKPGPARALTPTPPARRSP